MVFRLLAALVLLFAISTQSFAKDRILVFAAASMKNVLEVIGDEFENKCACNVVFSFAGSGTLARQIEAGAPADMLISANVEWMDWLRARNVVGAEQIKSIAANRLIVAVGRDRKTSVSIKPDQILSHGRIAMADPVSVPAGKYGRQALESIGIWERVKKQLVFGENVRVSLALVARGDVVSAIVYRSDLLVEPRVKLGYLFDTKTHAPIEYLAAIIKRNGPGEKFWNFLHSAQAASIFMKFGFTATDDG